jgi:hypothetical protein
MMFERFMNCIVSFHMVCRLRYTASCTKSLEHLYYILLFYSSSCIHPVCILVCILCVSRHSSGTQSFLYLPVESYLRSYLTADSRTSPVPAILHFFIHFYPFLLLSFLDVREIYELHCTLSYCVSFTIHYILHSSDIHPFCILVCILCVCPVYVLSISGTPSFLSSSVLSYLRSYLTADSWTSPVPAISHFFILFYYIPFLDLREIYNLHCIVFLLCAFYDTILMHAHPGLPSRCVSRRISRLYPACTRRAFRSTSSVESYLRYYLTAHSWTSPVPAILHFSIFEILHF